MKAAAEHFGEILFGDGYVLGGAANTVDIAFGDAPAPMFEDPPNCWLHRQASFINSFFPEDAEAGTDYDWFPLPPIDQEGILFAGELTVAGQNRPEVVDFIYSTYYEQGKTPKSSDPRDLLEIADSICRFNEQPLELTPDLVGEAAERFFCKL